jgi:hypothetical protein
MSEQGIREAFDAYRADPGGEVRLDAATITSAGRRRVRRNQLLIGAAGLGVVATLVGAAVVVPQLGDDNERGLTVADAPTLPPPTGRDLTDVLRDEQPWSSDRTILTGGPARDSAAKFLAKVAPRPANVDTAWQSTPNGEPKVQWALITWADRGKAAEGLLTIDPNPVTIAIFPPPYQVCGEADTTNGSTCTVREVKGKGWLKEVRNAGTLRVTLQRANGTAVEFRLSQGAVTRAALAGGRQPLGRFPVDAKTVGDAVLGTS